MKSPQRFDVNTSSQSECKFGIKLLSLYEVNVIYFFFPVRTVVVPSSKQFYIEKHLALHKKWDDIEQNCYLISIKLTLTNSKKLKQF